MKLTQKLSAIVFLFISSLAAQAQDTTVTGKIFAFKDSPLFNVTISAKRSKKEVKGDEQVRFSIEVAKNDKLVFLGAGFERHVQRVKAGDFIDLKLLFKG